MNVTDSRDKTPRPPAMRRGFALVVVLLWTLGLWLAGAGTILGWWQGALLALCGLPLIAMLLGLDRPLPAALREGCALAAPIGMLWILNHRALGFWWVGDDPCHLVQVLDYGIWRPFVDPVGYFLTPLLNFSLGLDLKLFGLEPRAFYAHQLVSFTALLAIGHGFLRAYLRPAFASLALTLFVASTPALAVAQQQMNRHYLEGLLLLLASFVCFRRSVHAKQWWLAIPGAGLYLLATAAKEVFVPMILCLPFLAATDASTAFPSLATFRTWWRQAVPYALVLAFYGFWRLSMLGLDNSLSAYGALSGQFHSSVLLRRLPWLLGLTKPWQALAAGALLVAAAWVLCRRSKLFAAGLAVILAIVALPLIPVAGRLEPRHLFVVAFAAGGMVAAAVAATTRSRGREGSPGGEVAPGREAAPSPVAGEGRGEGSRGRAVAATTALVFALAAVIHSSSWTNLERSSRQYRTEGSYVLDGSRDEMLHTKLEHSHYLQCLSRLGRDVLARTSSPGFCGDLCYCAGTFPGESFREASDGRIVAVEQTPSISCNAERPLIVDMRHDERRGRLSWDLETLDGGDYQALLLSDELAPGVSIPIAIPPRGSMPFRLTEPLRFVLKYRSPHGWQTYSPVQLVEPGGHAQSIAEVSDEDALDSL